MEVFHLKHNAGGMHPLTGNAAVLQRVNTVRLLNRLRLGGPASRAELARATGLDAKTISNLSGRLLRDRLVVTRQAVARGRGRPAEELALNPEAALAVGVDFGASQVSVVVLDLAGKVRKRFHQEFGAARGKTFLLRRTGEAVRALIGSLTARERRALAGVGVSVPGLVDRQTGRVRNSVNIPGFRNVPLRALLEKRLGLPVILEEASRSMALAEIWFGPARARQDFICVDLGYGIGMGVVHGGLLYRGANEMGGEIGHTVVNPGGAVCRCSKRGCLETVASGRALGAMAKELPLKKYGIRSLGAKALCEAARAGDRKAARAIRKAGEAIGIAVANLVNLFDPGRVVLNGGLVKAGPRLTDPVRATADALAISPFNERCPVEVSTLGECAGAMGAAMLPLRLFFEFDNIRF